MGLFDDLKGMAGSVLGGAAGQSPIARSVLDMFGHGGGLSGLVQAFEQKGLGDIVHSWVGTGQNLPVSPQQIQQALGPQVAQMAAQHGITTEAATKALSQILPGLVDHLTPNGQLPAGTALEQGLSALRSKLGV
jgi:uncharacterized protein YidB (DUF937 family)